MTVQKNRITVSTTNIRPQAVSTDPPIKNTAASFYPQIEVSTADGRAKVIQDYLNLPQNAASRLELFHRASEETGSVVILDHRFGHLPLLIGKDESVVFLYKFIEVLDEVVEFKDIKRELPMLSYGQIASAIAFLRKLAQFNIRGIDIDALEDEDIENTPEFQAALRLSLEDQEDLRVRTPKL